MFRISLMLRGITNTPQTLIANAQNAINTISNEIDEMAIGLVYFNLSAQRRYLENIVNRFNNHVDITDDEFVLLNDICQALSNSTPLLWNDIIQSFPNISLQSYYSSIPRRIHINNDTTDSTISSTSAESAPDPYELPLEEIGIVASYHIDTEGNCI